VKSCKQCTILNYLGTSMCKEGKWVKMHL
jgi:hypothetical protein